MVDGIDLPLTLRHRRRPVARLDGQGRPWWWYPNLAGLTRLVRAAGFRIDPAPRVLLVPPGRGWPARRLAPGAWRSREARYEMLVGWRGDPHGVVVGD